MVFNGVFTSELPQRNSSLARMENASHVLNSIMDASARPRAAGPH